MRVGQSGAYPLSPEAKFPQACQPLTCPGTKGMYLLCDGQSNLPSVKMVYNEYVASLNQIRSMPEALLSTKHKM